VSAPRAAFFDMDRTLVRVNTANLFVKWRWRRGQTTWREALRVMRWMTQYTLGTVDAQDVTTRALATLRGVEEEAFRAECQHWYEETVREHVTEAARAEVADRRRRGYECVVLTASTPYATDPLADDLDIEHVLCTRLEVHRGRFTGTWEEPLCYGEGKVEVAERWARDRGVDLSKSAFYTDSVSDVPMLERVGEPRIVNPDPRLRLLAARRGWRVDRWR